MMEQHLRCNNQIGGYCRAQLTDSAVVTTCSHVFCTNCANKVGLAAAQLDQRRCPVCHTALPNTDDAVNTRLHPSEDYKTSVLSGLDPTTIMECASRALAFWTYQTTQEIFYQEYLAKNLREKYTTLSTAMDRIVNEANSEIGNLQNKISAMSIDQKSIQDKYSELVTQYREKSQKHAQTQYLYDALKKKILQRQVQTAASENVSQMLESLNARQAATKSRSHPEQNMSPLLAELLSHERNGNDHSQFEQEQLHPHQRSASSGAGSITMDMPPPARPMAASRIPHPVTTTPLHRSALPGANRTSAERSHVPPTNSHIDNDRAKHFSQTGLGSVPGLRPRFSADVVLRSSNTGHSRNLGGISSGMKIGSAGFSSQH